MFSQIIKKLISLITNDCNVLKALSTPRRRSIKKSTCYIFDTFVMLITIHWRHLNRQRYDAWWLFIFDEQWQPTWKRIKCNIFWSNEMISSYKAKKMNTCIFYECWSMIRLLHAWQVNRMTPQYHNKQTPIHTHEHPNKTFLEFRTTYPINLRWWDEICSRANDVIMAATKLMMPWIRLRIYDFDNN